MTGAVEMKNGQLLTPAGTVIVAGTVTIAGLLLESATTAPPGGATADRIEVPPTVAPPWMLGDVTVTESIVTDVAGGLVVVVVVVVVAAGVVVVGVVVVVVVVVGGTVVVHPDSRRLIAGAVPSLMSTVQSAGRT
ncbi:MAG: hypothetical protein ABWZ42_10310 [Ilumatobacteraceae bacterium]